MELSNQNKPSFSTNSIIKHDLSASVVVFLIALPLCLGIALASGAPLFSGLIAGIVGGIVVSMISGSSLSVSGPAAGLTVIVFSAIASLGSFQAFLLSVVIGGALQIAFAYLKAGNIANYFPSSVIKGMLAAIGLILILKQIPHAVGYDVDFEGDEAFFQVDNENTFSEILTALQRINLTAIIISTLSIIILIAWERPALKKLKLLPSPLLVVGLGISINEILRYTNSSLALEADHLVQIPLASSVGDFIGNFTFPDFTQIANPKIYIVAATLAVVASLESLLSLEAIDKLDPLKRKSPTNRELKAQGMGNMISGLLGGLPLTAVIVRGSANVNAGGRTKMSSFFHGVLLLGSIILIPSLLNKIPLAALAAILLMTGYKLTKVSLFKGLFKQGYDQFIPFVVTILAILLTDLLKGIGIGMFIGAIFILRRNIKNPFFIENKESKEGDNVRITLAEEVSFLNKPKIINTLESLKPGAKVVIDGGLSKYIDVDVLEYINDFKVRSEYKGIDVEFISMNIPVSIKSQDLHTHTKDTYHKLFVNNRKWVEGKLDLNPDYFNHLAEGQSPKFLFIGCSDSRVHPNEITGTDAGEMFTHRNIANLVVHTDINLMSVLQYSVEVLKVEHVIVCGHYGCGGVRAAVDGMHHGLIDKWLRNIKDVYRIYFKELEAIDDPELRHKRLVELNVREQVYNLCMTSIIQRAWKHNKNLHVHGWVYDMKKGLVKDLQIDVEQDFGKFGIYEFKDLKGVSKEIVNSED